MSHKQIRAQLAAIHDLAKGVKRKGQPGYHRVKRTGKTGKSRWEWVHESKLHDHERQSLHRMGIASLSADHSRENTSARDQQNYRRRTGLDDPQPSRWGAVLDRYAPPSRHAELTQWLDRYAETHDDAVDLLEARDAASDHGLRSDAYDEIARRAGFTAKKRGDGE